MQIKFAARAAEDLAYFEHHYPKHAEKIASLLVDICRSPYRGLGKPEPLKHKYAGYWARRINAEHRLVYCLDGTTIYVVQCRYHYDDQAAFLLSDSV